MSSRVKQGVAMALVTGVLILAYELLPDYAGLIVFSSIFGVALTAR